MWLKANKSILALTAAGVVAILFTGCSMSKKYTVPSSASEKTVKLEADTVRRYPPLHPPVVRHKPWRKVTEKK